MKEVTLRFVSSRIFRPVNALTLVRIPLAALLWLRPDDALFLVIIMVIAALTDILDGAVARFLDPSVRADRDNPGAWLDPLCDKIFVASLVALVIFHHAAPQSPATMWLALLLLVREVMLLPLLIYWAVRWRPAGRRVDFRAVIAGKATTVLQFTAVGALLFYPAALVVLAPLAATTGAISVIQVARRALRSERETPSRPG